MTHNLPILNLLLPTYIYIGFKLGKEANYTRLT
jgi:hypothetical protein